MIKRRLYFLLPDNRHAGAVVSELEARGIERKFMHAIAGRFAASPPAHLPADGDRYRARERTDISAGILSSLIIR